MAGVSPLSEGAQCYYWTEDTWMTVTVKKVHSDLDPPVYTIDMGAGRAERQTTRERLYALDDYRDGPPAPQEIWIIPRRKFAPLVLERLVTADEDGCVTSIHANAAYYHKVAPTLVLLPPAEEMTQGGQPGMQGAAGSETPADVKTLLRIKTGRTFEEALMKTHGKALLLNFYSPSLEVYPKDQEHCWDIYDEGRTTRAEIPNEVLNMSVPLNNAPLEESLKAQLTSDKLPIAGIPSHLNADLSALHRAMYHYKLALGRTDPWRLAWNKESARVVAYKLTEERPCLHHERT